MFDGDLELANVYAWVKVIDFGCVALISEQKNGYENYNIGALFCNAPEIHNQ
jgi:hypothetical protein